MTCDRVRSQLDEYFDGELSGQELELVGAHVAGCAACSAELETLERESALFSRYDRGFEPSPEFWDGVLARIADEDGVPARIVRPSFLSRLGAWLSPSRLVPVAAACAALVIAVAMGMTFLSGTDRSKVADGTSPTPAPLPPATNGKPAEIVAPAPVENVNVTTPSTTVHFRPRVTKAAPHVDKVQNSNSAKLSAPVRLAERQYLDAIAALSKDVESSKGGLDEKLKKPLDDSDRNIVLAKQAVEKNPADTEAVMNMLAAYDQKVEVLQSLARYQAVRNR